MENKRNLLNLTRQKEEETIWCQNKLSYYKLFHRISIDTRNEKNADTSE